MLNCITHLICPSICLESNSSLSGENQLSNLFNINAKSIEQESSNFMDKIWCVVQRVQDVAIIALYATFSAFLFQVNPSLFAIGFIVGIIFDENVEPAIQKIKNVWVNTGYFLGAVAYVLSAPVTIATTTLLWSSHIGALLSKY
jgi:hypothetical protein